MSEQKLRIGDIQTTELLYYDPDYVSKCYSFCKKRDIDCLPVIGDQAAFFQRNNKAEDFVRSPIDEDRRLSEDTFVFHPDLLERFRQAAVQFVYDREGLTGVIHFSDYNRHEVSIYIYSLLSEYERNLRSLANLNELTYKDMGIYFQEKLDAAKGNKSDTQFFKKRLNNYKRKEREMAQRPPFQGFYLNELIGLVNHKEIMPLDEKVVDLRNAIMHADELVHMVDVTTPDFIFDFGSFETFFQIVQSFLHDAARVKNRIAFVRGLEEMGRPA